jgi:hypothetical protein
MLVDTEFNTSTKPTRKTISVLSSLECGRSGPAVPIHYRSVLRDSLLPVMESGQAELVATDYAFYDSVSIEP